MSLTSEFPSDEIKRKFRPYDEYDLKRIIRIYYKWVRSCSCNSSGWLDWDDCEFCFRWQHAKRELVYRNCDHYCNTEVLQNTFPDLYSEFYKVPEVKIEMKKNVCDGPPVRYPGRKKKNYFRNRKR